MPQRTIQRISSESIHIRGPPGTYMYLVWNCIQTVTSPIRSAISRLRRQLLPSTKEVLI